MSDEYSIEEIHEMLDQLDEAIEWLNSIETSKIEVSEIKYLIKQIIESIIETESFIDSGNPA